MLASLQRWINDMTATSETQEPPTLALASAVLLCEVIRADYRLEPAELDALREELDQRFGLDDEALAELMDLAQHEAETAVDHHRFVRLVRDECDYEARVELVRAMWALAFSDGKKDALEEHRIRRLAELLHVSHSDFVRTRLLEQERAEGAAD
ncbi:TerB family tellurite resistance protein [Halomonas elongata]|uniref:tellurite resistance TerB family protein n=1 Tax=Halomonas elongata TaxID=2746 RepID=UPI000DCDC75C|nr:TerB family tellurite resistance protein [Halomonas elongata]RAW06079.1 TerB family tellurite resistance protein [Halomonas elongata]